MSAEVLKKLRYKEGRAAVANAPEGADFGLPAANEPDGAYEFLLIYVRNREEAEQWLPKALPHLAEDAVFWLAYPKQSSKLKTDINRDSMWRLVDEKTDYTLVSNVAIDDTWSALRLRHKSKTAARAKK